MKKIIALLVISAFIFGCLEEKVYVDANRITYGEPQTYYEKESAINQGLYPEGLNPKTYITVTLDSIADSRCKEGVVCVWEGELGANLTIDLDGSKQQLYIGERTRDRADVNGYEIRLVSVDPQEKTATLIVTKSANSQGTSGEKKWLSFEPKQCGTNEWEQWLAERDSNLPEGAMEKTFNHSSEKSVVSAWLEIKYDITAYDYASRQVSEIVCMSCSCPRGDEIAVLVDSSNSGKMEAMGWKKIEGVACTEEAKLCPDGSGVGRQAPFCQFAPCPQASADTNTSEITIKKTDVPGFAVNPKTVSTTIESSGWVTIETSTYNSETDDGNTTTETRILSDEEKQKLAEIADFILSSNYFTLTEEDTRQCIADAPTKTLEVSIGSKSKTVAGIGSECEHEKLADAASIIEKLEELVPTQAT